MKKNPKIKAIYGITAFAIVALLVTVSFTTAFPFKGKAQPLTDEQKTALTEQNEAIKTAIENQDFSAWRTAMQSRLAFMQSQLTEENFNTIVEMQNIREEFHQALVDAKESGDYSQVKLLEEKYGIKVNNPKRAMHRMQPQIE